MVAYMRRKGSALSQVDFRKLGAHLKSADLAFAHYARHDQQRRSYAAASDGSNDSDSDSDQGDLAQIDV